MVLYVGQYYLHNIATYVTHELKQLISRKNMLYTKQFSRVKNLTFCTPTTIFVFSLVPILKQGMKDLENNNMCCTRCHKKHVVYRTNESLDITKTTGSLKSFVLELLWLLLSAVVIACKNTSDRPKAKHSNRA